MLTEQDIAQIRRGNDTEAAYADHATLVDLIHDQVNLAPDRTAVAFEDQSLTYGELWARSTRLARYLASLGVTRETLVGICVERSLDMVVAILGTLRAGGAYVPMDPDYPRARIEFMLGDSQAPFLLTHSHLAAKLRAGTAPPSSIWIGRGRLRRKATTRRCRPRSIPTSWPT